MTVHAINHVQLGFPRGGEDAVRRFYGTLVGLTELRYSAGGELHFVAGSQRIDLIPTEDEDWRPPPRTAVLLAFEVHNLPRLRQQMLAQQLPIEERQPLPGYLRFRVRDPAGNWLEFIEPDPTTSL
ncbi:MAG TPA: VOC family protein [Burkholderiaceae bacterium]